MTKKRLSDLLRQEAQKSLEEGSPAEPEQEAPAAESQPKPANRRRSPLQSTAKQTPQPKATTRSKTTPSTVVTADPVSADTTPLQQQEALITELKDTIATLQTSLSTAQHTEDALRQDITDLETALQQQRELVQVLKTDLKQAEQSQAELEQTKQLILTLSDNNIKLTQELATLKQGTALSKQSNGYSTNLELRRILEHPVKPEQPSASFTDAEIGWVD